MLIRHRDEAVARKLAGYCVEEVDRLERIFSLYRADSEISRLNRDGLLDRPSHEMRLLLAEARRFGGLSRGAFDVTVQPLWRIYSNHFASNPAAKEGPDRRKVEAGLSLVDYSGIDLDNGRARMARWGMAVTLNGLAQGYITDRIADMLRDAGLTDVLVDLGEIRALEGGAWKVRIEDPRNDHDTVNVLPLRSGALATSAGLGSKFDIAGKFHHLLNPRSGACAAGCLSASAIARSATTADALATALAVSSPVVARDLLHAFGGQRAILMLPDGQILDIPA
jgi:thiamine biosynthesis lipoprotein